MRNTLVLVGSCICEAADYATNRTVRGSAGLVGFGTQADELEQAGGGAEDYAGDEKPRVGAEPFIEEPAQTAE